MSSWEEQDNHDMKKGFILTDGQTNRRTYGQTADRETEKQTKKG